MAGAPPASSSAVRGLSGGWPALLSSRSLATASISLMRFSWLTLVALELIDGYCDHIFRGAPLGPRFGRTYGPSEELLARYAQG